ncbi:hypothetical protein [Nonomuraea typhae]|uniref:hypothetical protein n=1 Tax=Nonomuraea typhae TaxID=2603600 RepID=UPI0012F9E713|nr:hypothetical protein [Nonomuraea typhae]
MIDIDDLYGPGDDREPEPDDQGDPPLDLEEVRGLIVRLAVISGTDDDLAEKQAESRLLDEVLPQALAEIEELRKQLAEWEALEKRIEIVAAPGEDPDKTAEVVSFQSVVKASEHADERPGWNVFTRIHTLQPWQQLDEEKPF